MKRIQREVVLSIAMQIARLADIADAKEHFARVAHESAVDVRILYQQSKSPVAERALFRASKRETQAILDFMEAAEAVRSGRQALHFVLEAGKAGEQNDSESVADRLRGHHGRM